MQLNLINYIRKNPPLYHYLKYHSYWYKELNRNPSVIKELEQEMKKEYKLTAEDKINKINERMGLIASFLDVLR